MTAHTKGPWSFHHNGHYWEFTSNEFQLGDVCASQFTDPGTEEANARLIAAAPDLLTALSELLERAKRGLADPEDVPEVYGAERAIAKAKGESDGR